MTATNIRKLREAKGIKQNEMAKLLGYKSPSKYWEIENGDKGLPVKKAVIAAEILECTLEDIFLPSNFPNCPKGEDQ